jgi:hypothetical protein
MMIGLWSLGKLGVGNQRCAGRSRVGHGRQGARSGSLAGAEEEGKAEARILRSSLHPAPVSRHPYPGTRWPVGDCPMQATKFVARSACRAAARGRMPLSHAAAEPAVAAVHGPVEQRGRGRRRGSLLLTQARVNRSLQELLEQQEENEPTGALAARGAWWRGGGAGRPAVACGGRRPTLRLLPPAVRPGSRRYPSRHLSSVRPSNCPLPAACRSDKPGVGVAAARAALPTPAAARAQPCGRYL